MSSPLIVALDFESGAEVITAAADPLASFEAARASFRHDA